MEREDPLERIERERAAKARGGSLKTTMYALAAVAALLFITLVVVWVSKSKLVNELNIEKDDLTTQIESLQTDYESLSSEYDSINCQLDSSREEVAQLVERIKKTDATNRAKMRQYEKELGTLRSIMRNYVVQIDSLNTLNHKLTVDAANARKEAAATSARNKELTAKVEDLSGQIAAGSILKARGLTMEAYNAGDKRIDNSRNVKRLLVTLSLVENELAPKGPTRVYVRVTSPSGALLQDGNGATFTFNGETLDATASREVDYEGKEVEMSIYVNNVPSFEKGIYTMQAYTSQGQIGSAEMLLR